MIQNFKMQTAVLPGTHHSMRKTDSILTPAVALVLCAHLPSSVQKPSIRSSITIHLFCLLLQYDK